MSEFLRWLGLGPPKPRDDHAVARQAYADYLRAQIIGFAPAEADALLAALAMHDDEESGRCTAPFALLMGIETKLVGLLSDDLVQRTYWVVRERFNRVIGAAAPAAILEHAKWLPGALVDASDRVPRASVEAPSTENTAPDIDAAVLALDASEREAALRHEQAADIAKRDGADGPAAPPAEEG